MSAPKKKAAATLFLTDRALADIQNIERFSASEWGSATAGKYVAEIGLALDRLKIDPNLLRLEPAFSPDLYFYRVRKHLLACDLDGNAIIVLAIVHTSMDVYHRLNELQPRLQAEVKLLRDQLRARGSR